MPVKSPPEMPLRGERREPENCARHSAAAVLVDMRDGTTYAVSASVLLGTMVFASLLTC